MSNWQEYRLADICKKIGSGATPRGGNDTYLKEGEYALIRSQNVIDFEFSYNGLAYISEEQASKLNNVIVELNDVLLNITGDSVARVCTPPKNVLPARVNQHVAIIRANDNILNPLYLKYYLLNPVFKEYMLMLSSSGGTRNAITKGMIEEFKISAPDLPTQTAIAEILSSLDDKIELNNKINQELENLAQTLFKRWFIDFEFPNENGEPYKSSGGEMVDNVLGDIPKGWEVKTLDDISKITIGRTPPRQERHWFSTDKNDVKWISIRDMGNSGAYIHSTSEFLTVDAIEKFKIPIIESNTVIMSFKLTVGRISITTERMLSNEAIAHLNLTELEIYPEFLYLYLKQFNFDSLGSTSSIATAVNSKSIKSLPFVQPGMELLYKFEQMITPIFLRIYGLTFENKDLTNLRDTLLPKLISGELEVQQVLSQTT